MARITALNVYPVKGCRGVSLESARIAAMGFEHDREWLITRPDGRFMTQREEPRLALIEPSLIDTQAPGVACEYIEENDRIDATAQAQQQLRARGHDGRGARSDAP